LACAHPAVPVGAPDMLLRLSSRHSSRHLLQQQRQSIWVRDPRDTHKSHIQTLNPKESLDKSYTPRLLVFDLYYLVSFYSCTIAFHLVKNNTVYIEDSMQRMFFMPK
jgi:hypothetical protein